MEPTEIKIELLKRKTSQTDIARHLIPPVTPQAVHHVIQKKWISRRIMNAVAGAIDQDVQYVFPEYFFKKTG